MKALKSLVNAVGHIVAPEDYAPIEKTEEQLKNQLLDEIIIAEDNEFRRWRIMARAVSMCPRPRGKDVVSKQCEWHRLDRKYLKTLETVMNKLRKHYGIEYPDGLSIPEILKELADREKTFWKPMRDSTPKKEREKLPKYRKITEEYWNSHQRHVDFPILDVTGTDTWNNVLRRVYDGPGGEMRIYDPDDDVFIGANKRKGKKATKNKDKKATKKKDKKATKKRGKKATKKTRRRKKSI